MKCGSSRSHQTLSSASTRTYVPGISRRLSSGRSEDSSSSSSSGRSKKMKCVIVVGIALPVVAAIIGIVAWAVSAESAFPSHVATSLRRVDTQGDFQEADIFQSFSDRRGSHQSSPMDLHSQDDFSRVDSVQQESDPGSAFAADRSQEKDPLYIVHFVPSPQPRSESSTSEPPLAASTVSSDVLKKILSASKGAKPGTPQFVVFAPVPEEQDLKNEDNSLNDEGQQGINFFSNSHQPVTNTRDLDYDYEEELRKYQENLKSNTPSEDESKSSESSKATTKQLSHDYLKKSLHVEAKNYSTDTHSGRSVSSAVHPQLQNLNNQQLIHLQLPQQKHVQNVPREYHQQQQQQQPQQLLLPKYQQVIPQDYQQALQQNHHHLQQQHYHQQQDYQQAASQYVSPQADRQEPVYSQYPIHHQPAATDRSGQFDAPAIKLSFGGPQKSILGGSYSPLGIIGSILGPLLPKPQVNLNGKVMFGVMLEKGLKFGDNKPQYHQGG